MSDYLLVPTNLQAFVVGKPGEPVDDLARVPQNEHEVARWYVDSHFAFSLAQPKLPPLATGVHLHWALPAALMRLRFPPSPTPPPAPESPGPNKATRPYIPNRWLVLRMWRTVGKPTISSQAWVLESDYVSRQKNDGIPQNEGTTPFFFFGTNSPPVLNGNHCGYVGRAVDLSKPEPNRAEKWQESQREYRFELTSLGWGDPSFTAYYPACKGVLGFHDTMEGVSNGDLLAYLVVGWYSEAAKDPLQAAGKPATVEKWTERLASLGWCYPNSEGLDFPSLPQQTLCHGAVVNIQWSGPDQNEPAQTVGACAPTCAIGGSAAEALAALLAPDQQDLQQVLCAFQHGQATHVSTWNQLGDLLHRHSFAAVPGGALWTVEPGYNLQLLSWGDGKNVPGSGHNLVIVGIDAGSLLHIRIFDGGPEPSIDVDERKLSNQQPEAVKALKQRLPALLVKPKLSVAELDEVITQATSIALMARPEPAAVVPSPPPPLSANVQEKLFQLNEAQQALDRQAREVESRRGRLFARWADWASKQDGPTFERPKRDAVVDLTKSALADLNNAIGGVPQKEQRVEKLKQQVTEALTTEHTRMRLAKSTRPPFLRPKDPFVVLKGDQLVPVDRTRPQRAAKDANGQPLKDAKGQPLLGCRLDKDVVTGVTSSRAKRGTEANKKFSLNPPRAVGTLPDDVRKRLALTEKLALETVLFDPGCADLIDTGDPKLFRDIQASLQESLTRADTKLTWDGTPPDPLSITSRDECNPWLPVYLLWQANWSPEYAPGQLLDKDMGALAYWQFDSRPNSPAGDLVPTKGPPPTNAEVLLEGATIVSVMSGAQFAKNLGDFAELLNDSIKKPGESAADHQDFATTLKVESIKRNHVLGQSLGGFNDLLLKQTVGLCLPPFDPVSKQVDTDVWSAMGEIPQPVMPVTGARDFLPVRTGALKLVSLYVVDSFGQTRKLIDSSASPAPQPKVIASPMLPQPPGGYHARFSPRLAQPARLNFDWQPADDKASAGPVCGWIVANYLEKSFAVFSASGQPLGALETVLTAFGSKTNDSPKELHWRPMTFEWRPIPGSNLKVEEISNPRLKGFVQLLINKDLTGAEGQAFLELVDLVLRKTEGRIPPDNPAVNVLVGRPLALAHASLQLELHGLPAGYWQLDAQRNLVFTTEGHATLPIPVRLGGMNLPSDGLVGYMLDSDPTCLIASDAVEKVRIRNSPRIQYRQNLAVTAADQRPVSLTLLMDASAPVHATTGVLPRHRIALPAEATRLPDLSHYVCVAPVLGDKRQPAMPWPSDAFGHWSWATRPPINPSDWHQIMPADDRARFTTSPALTEGWLRLEPERKQDDKPAVK